MVKESIKYEKCQKKHDGGNKKKKKGCMPFCYCIKSFVLKMVSSSRSITIGEEEPWVGTNIFAEI
jgi:hypothetical protein